MAAPGASHSLRRLLRPRSIAVIGGKAAGAVVAQLDRLGYAGEIWPVHPRAAEVEGRRAYPSVAALPAAPDAAFLGINRHDSIEVMGALAARGAGGAVAYASGFAEAGAGGRALQDRLAAAAGAMPFFGPNCHGFINYADGALLWPDQHGGKRVSRGVAIVTQSGNIGLNLTMQRRALPIAYLVTLGNQAAIGAAAVIEALLEDERVTAIGLHLEGLDDAAGVARAAARGRERGVPIVALKTGRSAAGAQLAISHTAALAGADAAMDAYLRKIGIVRVPSLAALIETLKLLHVHGPLPGRDIASMSCSGGEAALIADAAEGRRLRFRAPSEAAAARLAAILPELVAISNPLDYHSFIWGDEAALTETFAAMMAADYALTCLILDFPRRPACDDRDWLISAAALIAAARRSGRRAAVLASLPETMPEERAEMLMTAGIAPLCGIEDALAAIEAAADAGEAVDAQAATFAATPPLRGAGIRSLSEREGKRALAGYGLAIPEGRLAATAEAAMTAAAALGFPVAVKAAGARTAHKTEIGGVRLGLGDAAAVGDAVAALLPLGEAVLVERMVEGAVAELIIGARRDPVIGLHLLIGAGGVFTEILADSRPLVPRASRQEIEEALRALAVARLLDGYRGQPAGDVEAAIAAVLALQSFVLDNADRLIECEINPLIVRRKGEGAVVADALIRLADGATDA